MTWTQAIIAYVVSWWMLLFMIAPLGMGSGKPRLPLKCAAVTVLAVFLTWGIDIAIQSGIVPVK